MKHKEAFNGVVVLTAALIVKILSVYRIPYQNILGDTGLYAYQQVYRVALGMILSMNAIPSATKYRKYHSDEA